MAWIGQCHQLRPTAAAAAAQTRGLGPHSAVFVMRLPPLCARGRSCDATQSPDELRASQPQVGARKKKYGDMTVEGGAGVTLEDNGTGSTEEERGGGGILPGRGTRSEQGRKGGEGGGGGM